MQKFREADGGKEGAREAVGKEWRTLEGAQWPGGKGKGAWGCSNVRDAHSVRSAAEAGGMAARLARVAELPREENSELPNGHPGRAFKAGCVVLGYMLKDESFEAAVCAEVTSAPAAIKAARALDALVALATTPQRRRMVPQRTHKVSCGGGGAARSDCLVTGPASTLTLSRRRF